MKNPICILQMQRMGDLVLTFPLILWLHRLYPGHEIWVVGEESFFSAMYHVSPQAVFFPWSAAPRLKTRRFEAVVNLSHRDKAAILAGSLDAETVIGPFMDKDGVRRIRGDFQLYRASLTGCNRHNRFHWAELNALDLAPLSLIAATRPDPPRRLPPEKRTVGLFVGASEAAKRPAPAFFGQLAVECLKRGLRPVLLGGPGEKDLAAQALQTARERARGPVRILNLAGKLSLKEFIAVGQTMALLVTPDTGPMHLAAWTGLSCLNLSLGNVHPWETGPYQPGHHVLRAAVSCSGCWSCERESHLCHAAASPRRVALLADHLTAAPSARTTRLRTPGARLLRTGKGPLGLYALSPATGETGRAASARDLSGAFWQAYFGARLGLWGEAPALYAATRLREDAPGLAAALGRAMPRFARSLGQGLRGTMPDDFWRAQIPFLRPLASWLHMALANDDFSAAAQRKALSDVEACLSFLLPR